MNEQPKENQPPLPPLPPQSGYAAPDAQRFSSQPDVAKAAADSTKYVIADAKGKNSSALLLILLLLILVAGMTIVTLSLLGGKVNNTFSIAVSAMNV